MEQLKYLEEKLETDISGIQKRSNKNRNRSALMGVSAIVFGACVTICLGVQINVYQELLKNIALICGVLVTVVNSIDRFFNFRVAWVKQTVTIIKLKTLKSEIELYKLGLQEDEKADEDRISKFLERYKGIWELISGEWSELRTPEKQEEEARK